VFTLSQYTNTKFSILIA